MTRRVEFAWSAGDLPGELSFRHRVDEKRQQVITKALAADFPPASSTSVELYALHPGDTIAGGYKLLVDGDPYFLRITMHWGKPALEKDICSFLASRGVAINAPLLTGLALQVGGSTYRIDVRPFIDGRHTDFSIEDCSAISKLLSPLHHAFRDLPSETRQQVFDNTIERAAVLSQAKQVVAKSLESDDYSCFEEHKEWAMAERDFLAELANKFAPAYHELPDAQCLHGELHPANVIFDRERNLPLLIDFEESVHVFAPTIWDVAYFFQRFCCREDSDGARIEECYRACKGVSDYSLEDLAHWMEQLSYRAIASILALRLNQGLSSPRSEFEKFSALARRAKELTSS